MHGTFISDTILYAWTKISLLTEGYPDINLKVSMSLLTEGYPDINLKVSMCQQTYLGSGIKKRVATFDGRIQSIDVWAIQSMKGVRLMH